MTTVNVSNILSLSRQGSQKEFLSKNGQQIYVRNSLANKVKGLWLNKFNPTRQQEKREAAQVAIKTYYRQKFPLLVKAMEVDANFAQDLRQLLEGKIMRSNIARIESLAHEEDARVLEQAQAQIGDYCREAGIDLAHPDNAHLASPEAQARIYLRMFEAVNGAANDSEAVQRRKAMSAFCAQEIEERFLQLRDDPYCLTDNRRGSIKEIEKALWDNPFLKDADINVIREAWRVKFDDKQADSKVGVLKGIYLENEARKPERLSVRAKAFYDFMKTSVAAAFENDSILKSFLRTDPPVSFEQKTTQEEVVKQRADNAAAASYDYVKSSFRFSDDLRVGLGKSVTEEELISVYFSEAAADGVSEDFAIFYARALEAVEEACKDRITQLQGQIKSSTGDAGKETLKALVSKTQQDLETLRKTCAIQMGLRCITPTVTKAGARGAGKYLQSCFSGISGGQVKQTTDAEHVRTVKAFMDRLAERGREAIKRQGA